MSTALKHNYVSEIDQFLQDFDQQNPPKSAAQQREISKHARIHQLRDQSVISAVVSPDKEPAIWEKF
jgi:hypothetical protein